MNNFIVYMASGSLALIVVLFVTILIYKKDIEYYLYKRNHKSDIKSKRSNIKLRETHDLKFNGYPVKLEITNNLNTSVIKVISDHLVIADSDLFVNGLYDFLAINVEYPSSMVIIWDLPSIDYAQLEDIKAIFNTYRGSKECMNSTTYESKFKAKR